MHKEQVVSTYPATRIVCNLTLKLAGISQSVQRLATGWTVRRSNPGGGEIFRTRPDWPWCPPSLLQNGYLVFLGGKVWPWRGVDHPPNLAMRLKKQQKNTSTPPLGLRGLFLVELYLTLKVRRMPAASQSIQKQLFIACSVTPT